MLEVKPISGISKAQLVALAAFLLLNFLDVATTHAAMQEGLVEGNLVPALLHSTWGQTAMYAFKFGSVFLVVATVLSLSRSFKRLWYGVYIGDALLLGVVLLNSFQVWAA